MNLNLNPEGLIELSDSKRVELNPYVQRPLIPRDYMSDAELQANAGGYLFADVELYPNYFLCGFKCHKTKKYLKMELPFNVQKLSWILHSYHTVGFNSIKYDNLMMWASYVYQDLEKLKQISDAIIFQNMYFKEVTKEFGFQTFPTKHTDLIEVCPLRGSLKLYGARLHAKRIQELPYPVHKILTEEEKEIVANYNCNDLDITELVFDNLKEQLQLRANLSVEYRSDLMSRSDAQIAESVIGNELKKITGHWPKKPEIDTTHFYQFKVPNNLFFQTDALKQILQTIADTKFAIDVNGRLERSALDNLKIAIGSNVYRMGIGGLHSSETCTFIKEDDEYEIKDRDVASYYPAIVLNQKLYPKHLGTNFLDVYRTLRDRRIEAKRNKNIAQSENLKVTINGTFGKTGSPYSFLYAPEMTIQITIGGQLYLLMLIEYLELNGIPVYSANTDGIVIKLPKAKKDLYLNIIKQWEAITGFETEETDYAAVYSRDVNAYLAVKHDGKTKGKNIYYDPWNSTNPKDLYWRFQKNPTAQICVEAVEKHVTKQIPLETTIKECRDITRFLCVKNVTGGAHKDREYLGKVIRWYWAKDVVGTINYITSNNKVPDSEGAKPCMDLPDEFPNDIDYARYVKRAKEMLEDMAYLPKAGQLKFF
jgi:hypothetical protein